MPHQTAPLQQAPDDLAKAKLEAHGLGDPKIALHQAALRDLYFVAIIFIAAFMAASSYELGDWYIVAVTRHADWELDEIAIAAMLSMIAFCWFAWRQWQRFADELTRRIKLEEEIMEMRVLADHLGQNKSVFLANLAHDLRTPLNGVLGFAQLLEEEPFGPIDNEHYKDYVKSIRESAAMLGERLTTCLDPDKVEFGAEPLQMKPRSVKDLIESAVRIVEPVARSTGIGIQIDVSSDLPEIHTDDRAIKKILVNLVTNAIKFSRPSGRIRIAAKLTTGRGLALIVEDDGVGLGLDDLDPRWSHPELIAPEGDNGPRYGMDIGLAVVKRLLEMHGATFGIRSVPNRGTTITMIFPPDRLVQSGASQTNLAQAG